MRTQETYKVALIEEPHGEFKVVEVPRLKPQTGQALVKVWASALNPLDAKIRAGQAAHARHPLPAILGIELAGVIEELGLGTEGFRVGDEVMGMVGGVGGLPGTLAEYVIVDVLLLAKKPARLSAIAASTLPLAFLTAWEGLIDRAHIQKGQTVLVQAGAGGVGHVAVQLAVAKQAEVFATGRESQRAIIEAAGATFINIEDELEPMRSASKSGFDVVYDTLGGVFLDRSFQLVKELGHVVSCLGWGQHSLAALSFKGASYSGVFTLEPLLSGKNRSHVGHALAEASKLAEAGLLKPRISPETFTLDTVNEAYAQLLSRDRQGRIVVSVAS